VSEVYDKLKDFYALKPSMVLEPTFGTGHFIEGAINKFTDLEAIFGIEINPFYFSTTQNKFIANKKIKLYNSDIFTFDFNQLKSLISINDELLIIGNPPWVTNSQLSVVNSSNIPHKSNFKTLPGIDAITGKGNFDISEFIITLLLTEFSLYNCTLAMLCKTIVCKNIIRDIQKYNFSFSSADMFVFNAKSVFNVNCDASLLVIRLGKTTSTVCNVFDFKTNTKIRQFGWKNGLFCSDLSINTLEDNIDGHCQLEWRQGIKHDCSKVMELVSLDNSYFLNGLGDKIRLNIGDYIFPLVKSSDIKSFEIINTRKYVIVPQKFVNEDTSHISQNDTDLWQYLLKYQSLLNARRSIIYRKSPKFSVFGVGDYSFAKYKVGLSGFYKEPIFALISGTEPIMLDDTCYFLSFDDITDAIITTALLNSPTCKSLLKSLAFLDSKRPYTKEILKRIDLLKLSKIIPYSYVIEFALNLTGKYTISNKQIISFQNKLSENLRYGSKGYIRAELRNKNLPTLF
jgi:16S rRNA A1518/A1519 N6-dimethyltransferase RsmA/KsgA/DIM1 with predicted DNA glycosylase/AP lyase activity